jgi:hypothetical protein
MIWLYPNTMSYNITRELTILTRAESLFKAQL